MQKFKISSEDSAAIEWLRFPLIVCVVFIHSSGEMLDFSTIDWSAMSGREVVDLIQVFFSRVVTHFAVPCFYFISGYLFFCNVNHFDLSVWKSKMRSRAYTLLLPYVLWNLIFIAAIAGKVMLKCILGMEQISTVTSWYGDNGGLFGLLWNCNVWGEDSIGWSGNPQRSSGPIDLPLWYLRDLIVVSLLTPAIHWLLRRFGLWFVTLLGLAFVSRTWPLVDGLSITALFFFSVGAYMGERKISISAVKKYQTLIYIAAVVLTVADTLLGGPDTYVGNIVHPFFRIAGFLAALCIALHFSAKGHAWRPMLTHSVFFIYAFHGLYIVSYYFGGLWLKAVGFDYPVLSTIVYLLVPALKISVCLIVYIVLERTAPRLLALLTGRRG